MSTTILERPRQSQRSAGLTQESKPLPPLLVATDASPGSDAALRAARVISARTHQSVKVIAVHPPQPIVVPEAQIPIEPAMDVEGRAILGEHVREQMRRLALDGMWPTQVMSGDPAATIANVARSTGASLVIMGLGGHGLIDRVIGDELVLKVLRLGTVPVLGVAPSFRRLPLNVLAAIDFSASSVRAFATAVRIVQPDATAIVAHVVTPDLDPVNWNGATAAFQGTIGRALDRVIAEVGFGDMTIERKILAGDPAKELLRVAETSRPDLIVTGSHGHNFLSRLLLGSVSTRLVRKASCSILVVPPEDALGFMEELPTATEQFASYEWAERLEEFTRRNSGREATLEVIDPEIGAQVEHRGVPFLGASFDPRDARVQLMFGAPDGRGSHLTRSIGGVTAVQMLRDRSGKDLFLRVAHGRGQTLLTLER
jgi:nucleotide-binding universal stress UspA family protein